MKVYLILLQEHIQQQYRPVAQNMVKVVHSVLYIKDKFTISNEAFHIEYGIKPSKRQSDQDSYTDYKRGV